MAAAVEPAKDLELHSMPKSIEAMLQRGFQEFKELSRHLKHACQHHYYTIIALYCV